MPTIRAHGIDDEVVIDELLKLVDFISWEHHGAGTLSIGAALGDSRYKKYFVDANSDIPEKTYTFNAKFYQELHHL